MKAFMGMLRGVIPDLADYRLNKTAPRAVLGWRLNASGLKYFNRAMSELKYPVGVGSTPNRVAGEHAGDDDTTAEVLV